MKKKTFLVFILFLTWLNYLLSYEYVKTMMDTAAIIKIISSIVLLIITLIYQTNEYVDIRKICYLSDDLLIWKIVSILFYIAIVLFAAYILWSNVKYSFLGITWFLSSILLASFYFIWIKNLSFRLQDS